MLMYTGDDERAVFDAMKRVYLDIHAYMKPREQKLAELPRVLKFVTDSGEPVAASVTAV